MCVTVCNYVYVWLCVWLWLCMWDFVCVTVCVIVYVTVFVCDSVWLCVWLCVCVWLCMCDWLCVCVPVCNYVGGCLYVWLCICDCDCGWLCMCDYVCDCDYVWLCVFLNPENRSLPFSVPLSSNQESDNTHVTVLLPDSVADHQIYMTGVDVVRWDVVHWLMNDRGLSIVIIGRLILLVLKHNSSLFSVR